MTIITVEVPDHLAKKVDSIRDLLPHLLSEALMLSASDGETATAPSMRHQVFEEMIDFLGTVQQASRLLRTRYRTVRRTGCANFWIRTEKKDSPKPRTPNSTLSSLWMTS
jgi:hypothetical protein